MQDKLNLDFLNESDSAELALSELARIGQELNEVSAKFHDNIDKKLNEFLASGTCYFKGGIMYVEIDGQDKAVLFPEGNAIEYQASNGSLSPSEALKITKLLEEANNLIKGGSCGK